MTNFTWSIDSIATVQNPNPNYVATVNWKLSSEVNSKTVSVFGTTSFNENIESTNFIPYDDLTEEIVINWVKESLGAEGIEKCENNLQNEINLINNPPAIPQPAIMPWKPVLDTPPITENN